MKKDVQKPILFSSIADVISKAREQAYRSTNTILLQMYWQIGKLIVEDEQKGQAKAVYGQEMLKNYQKSLPLSSEKALMKVIYVISASFILLFQNVTHCVTN